MNYIQPVHKYYRIFAGSKEHLESDELSAQLRAITGLGATDYSPAVTRPGGDICTFISDESEFKSHVCVGTVLLPFLNKDDLNRYEESLEELIARCHMPHIRFSDIFGRKQLAKSHHQAFLEEYASIVSAIPMSCLSLARSRNALVSSFGGGHKSNEELFHSLFWKNFARIFPALKPFSIVHIYREVENNLTPALAVREFEKLLSGAQQVSATASNAPSICRHPHFFTKRALLYSSLSDLSAYASNMLQCKLDSGVPPSKIRLRHKDVLTLLKSVFRNYSGLSEGVVELVRAG